MTNLAGVLAGFGFQQVIPPLLEDRKIFFAEPDLKMRFGSRLLEVTGIPGRDAVLAPTHFLGVLRNYVESVKAAGPHVAKWFYVSPVVEGGGSEAELSHELGIFVLGEQSALATAHLVNAVTDFFAELGISGFITEINSVGCRICQKDYFRILEDHLRNTRGQLCRDCAENLGSESTAVWHCPSASVSCRELLASAPQIVDFLDEACRANLVGVLETLDELAIPYLLNPSLAGLFLQEKVLFQVSFEQPEAAPLGYGGNYSAWAERVGGTEGIPLLGFRTTLEKLRQFISPDKRKTRPPAEVFMIPLGEVACRRAMVMYRALKQAGIRTAEAMLGNSGIKNQLREAVDHKSDIALIIGQKEAIDETVILRDMRSGMQEVFSWDRTIEEVKKRLGK